MPFRVSNSGKRSDREIGGIVRFDLVHA